MLQKKRVFLINKNTLFRLIDNKIQSVWKIEDAKTKDIRPKTKVKAVSSIFRLCIFNLFS